MRKPHNTTVRKPHCRWVRKPHTVSWENLTTWVWGILIWYNVWWGFLTHGWEVLWENLTTMCEKTSWWVHEWGNLMTSSEVSSWWAPCCEETSQHGVRKPHYTYVRLWGFVYGYHITSDWCIIKTFKLRSRKLHLFLLDVRNTMDANSKHWASSLSVHK